MGVPFSRYQQPGRVSNDTDTPQRKFCRIFYLILFLRPRG